MLSKILHACASGNIVAVSGLAMVNAYKVGIKEGHNAAIVQWRINRHKESAAYF